jgi:hypothetical protein
MWAFNLRLISCPFKNSIDTCNNIQRVNVVAIEEQDTSKGSLWIHHQMAIAESQNGMTKAKREWQRRLVWNR